MPRFFIEQELPAELAEWVISGEDARHIGSVLRMAVGDELTLSDGQRTDYLARISAITSQQVTVEIISRAPNQTESPLEIWLFQGLPKSDKLDGIIQKSVELGVAQIIPMACERSVVRVDAKDAPRKVERWNKIAREAAKQCGRGLLPDVAAPLSFKAAITAARSADLALIPWESEREQSLRAVLETHAQRLLDLSGPGQRPRIAILVGPEGGFSLAEIDLALQAGITPVTLGRRILRTETAGPAVLAMLGYQFNDF
jgi:16S rRNA (uracil1498-N3)-methyltransferase